MDDNGEPPEEWIISRLCEEFGCLPTEALREMEQAPAGLLAGILELRAYAHAKTAIDQAKRQEDIPQSSMIDTVFDIQAEIIRERQSARGK